MYGDGSALSAAAVDEFLESDLTLEQLERHLTLRTYVAGHTLTIADIVSYCRLAGEAVSNESVHVKRWMALVESKAPETGVKKTGGASEDSTKKKINAGSAGSFAKMELHDAVPGKVVVRFPPEPSGFLHIGHCKAVLLNDYYRREYKGKLIVRFDDTNPAKEKTEFVDSILEDLKILGIVPDKVSFTSDHFDYILECAEKLIKQGDAYVDDQDQELIQAQRFDKKDGPSRDLAVDEQLRRWREMLAGTEYGKTCVMRAKISMQHKNSALRDPALARCVDHPHQRTGDKYKCYPTYDLAISVVDSLEGVTHAMRDSQYQERIPLYHWVMEKLALRPVTIRQFSRINFTHTILSKRKLQYFVDNGFVSGWDDPALPTVRGIFNRGLTIEALTEFILSQGASLSLTNMSMAKLWNFNKKIIDDIAPRYTCISNQSYAVHVVDGMDGIDSVQKRNLHPKNPALGTKDVHFAGKFLIEAADAILLGDNEEFTLLDWGNAVVVNKDDDKKMLKVKLNLAGNVKTTKRKVSWAVAHEKSPVVKLINIGNLITVESLPQKKKKKGKQDNAADDTPEVDWKTLINPDLKQETLCCGEAAMNGLKKGTKLQIVRRGFFTVIDDSQSDSLVLVDIPDGKEGPASVLVEGKKEKPSKK